MTKYFNLFIICAFFLAVFSGCEKDVKVSGITVEPKDLILHKGDVVQLACMVTPYSADNKSVKWTSKDVSVATVSEIGLVTAVAEGETQIVVTTDDGHFSDVVSVMVARGSPAGDSIALIKLYEISLNLPAWDFSQPMDQWQGVVLNDIRRVEYITLNNRISITDCLDVSIGNLACLKRLDLFAYYAASDVIIPPEIRMLTELQYLCLNYGFIGVIPPEWGNFEKLEFLEIANSQLAKGVPKELGNLVNLKRLDLINNQLIGSIPKELGNLAKLEGLDLTNNQLTGSIPKELGNLANLKGLDLTNNPLTGSIPKELGNLAKLEELSLKSNQLTGNIPRELGNLSNLKRLSIDYNQLTGEIPQELGNLPKLNHLELMYNSLSGTIPQSLLDRFDHRPFCPQNGTTFDNLDCSGY